MGKVLLTSLLCVALSSCSSEAPGSTLPAQPLTIPAAQAEEAAPGLPLRYMAHEGVELAYIEQGDPDGQMVLLLHGQRYDLRTWEQLGTLEILARAGYRAIALDLPGCGASAATPEPADRDEFLFEFVRGVGWNEPVLVAPSMSGRYALPFAALHPAALNGFVPIAPAGLDEYAERLAGSQVSTLIVWGALDQVLPAAGSARLQSLLIRSELALLPAAGHACYLEQPELFHATLLDWLQRNAPPKH